jgi:hypothetical protein
MGGPFVVEPKVQVEVRVEAMCLDLDAVEAAILGEVAAWRTRARLSGSLDDGNEPGAVTGKPHLRLGRGHCFRDLGEVPVAFVVVRDGQAAPEQAIRDQVAALLPRACVPARVIAIDSLPEIGIGKVDPGADDALELGAGVLVIAFAVPQGVVAVEADQFDHCGRSGCARVPDRRAPTGTRMVVRGSDFRALPRMIPVVVVPAKAGTQRLRL